jgi:hypothetical protein
MIFLPNDDTTPGTDGVQVPGIANVTGGDCVAVRSGLCTGAELSSDFADFDGESPHTSLFTLEDGVTSQSYCVEVRDHVGNVGGALNSVISTATLVSMGLAGVAAELIGVRNVFIAGGSIAILAGLASAVIFRRGEQKTESTPAPVQESAAPSGTQVPTPAC